MVFCSSYVWHATWQWTNNSIFCDNEAGHSLLRGLYCPPLIPARIRAIPGIPEESILAQGPAKLIKQFWWNVE